MVEVEGQNERSVVLANAEPDLLSCGVVMPISATANRSEKQWRDTQTLLHRGILEAGFKPRNVWESSTNDRISERIIGNIFEVPIAIADISDLNPNVMLELGLRLASKKPTVVVASAGAEIPFDIRDFQVTFYPSDLNMLGMEDFFKKLTKVLSEKYSAYKSNAYTPFLGGVIVDVVSPETREVGVNELMISRLNEISTRINDIESAIRYPFSPRSETNRVVSGKFTVELPEFKWRDFREEVMKLFEVDQVDNIGRDGNGMVSLEISYSAAASHSYVLEIVSSIARQYGGDIDVPF